jgi:thiol-disulfide isomerase/thioredoxin
MFKRIAAGTGLALAVLACVGTARSDDRKAEAIIQEIEAVKMPPIPEDRNDRKAVQEYLEARQKAMDRHGELTMELFRVDPNNDRLPQLFTRRWSTMAPFGPQAEQMNKELEEVAAGTKNDRLKAEAAFFQVRNALLADRQHPEKALDAANAFIKAYPKDERSSQILAHLASAVKEEALRKQLEDRLLKDYPESQAAVMLQGERKRREAIGKPFELSFKEAVTGKPIAMGDLKGKVVVIDFWATWCGPCVAEMPKMKELYAKYKDEGVEFIGISLDNPEDEGGLSELKKFVAEREIPWPQYYQGKGWESEFSGGWGINSIPAVFVVDANGNLYSTDARGKLEELIPELLAKAKKE